MDRSPHWDALIAAATVTSVVHVFARIVPCVGIVVPRLIPPAVAVVVALLIANPAIAALA